MKQDVLVFSNTEKSQITILAERLTSSDTELVFCIQNAEDKHKIESLCKDSEATRIITYGQYDDETLQVNEIKKYSQYTTLSYMGTEYGRVIDINYNEEDETTESGFVEQMADITEIRLRKKSYVQRQIDALKVDGVPDTGYATRKELLEVQSSMGKIEAAILGEEGTDNVGQ